MGGDWAIQKPEGVLVRVRVKPKSGKDSIESSEEALVVKISAPPVDNKANRALVAFLSKKLKIRKSAIQIQSGEKSRNKTLLVKDVSKEEIENKLVNS